MHGPWFYVGALLLLAAGISRLLRLSGGPWHAFAAAEPAPSTLQNWRRKSSARGTFPARWSCISRRKLPGRSTRGTADASRGSRTWTAWEISARDSCGRSPASRPWRFPIQCHASRMREMLRERGNFRIDGRRMNADVFVRWKASVQRLNVLRAGSARFANPLKSAGFEAAAAIATIVAGQVERSSAQSAIRSAGPG